jgi:hypothetical protein
MARKKKATTTTKTKEVIKTTPIKETTTVSLNGEQSISYAGRVNIKIQKGNKTLSTRKFDNSGMPNLFKFLCNCLAGNYAEKMRPCKVKLFSYIKATDPIDQRATVGEFN